MVPSAFYRDPANTFVRHKAHRGGLLPSRPGAGTRAGQPDGAGIKSGGGETEKTMKTGNLETNDRSDERI